MNPVFQTSPEPLDLGLLVARITAGTGADLAIDEAVMALFFTRDRRHIGAYLTGGGLPDEPVLDAVWVDPKTDKWVATHAREFTSDLAQLVRTIRAVMPLVSWGVMEASMAPAEAMVRPAGERSTFCSAPTVERALLAAFLVAASLSEKAPS